MRKLTLVLLFLCVSLHSYAQELSFSKVINSQGNSTSIYQESISDADGNLYIFGQFNKELLLEGTRLKTAGKSNAYLTKYNSDGQVTWTKPISGTGHVLTHSILLDDNGNIYLSGAFGRSCTFGGKTIKATNYQDNFVAKYNAGGEVVWVKLVSANTKAKKTILSRGVKGKILFAGSFYKTLQLGDSKIKATSNSDLFIVELDKEGEFSNLQHISGQNEEHLSDLVCSRNGDIYISGSFTGNIKLGNQLFESKGKEDIFLAKIKSNDYEWVKTEGSNFSDYVSKIVLKDEEVLIGGSFSDEMVFDKEHLVSKGALDAFICSYKKNGELNWASSFGSYANEYLNTLLVNKAGQIYIGGNFRGEIKKEDSRIKSEGLINDLFLAKYDNLGKFKWAKNMGGKGTDYANNILQGPENYLYLVGTYEKKIELGENELKTEEGSNFFIARFYDCSENEKVELGDNIEVCAGEYSLTANEGFKSYVWSNGTKGQVNFVKETGNYSVTAIDELGCESTDEVEVTLLPFPEVKEPEVLNLCNGESIRLDAGEGFETYFWSTGAKSRRISVIEEGEYSVEVSNEKGCKSVTSFMVQPVPARTIGLASKYQLKKGDDLLIEPIDKFESYKWSSGSTENQLRIKSSELNEGNYDYWVECTDKLGCTYQHNFQLTINDELSGETDSEPIIAKVSPNPSNGQFRLTLENLPENEKLEFRLFTSGGIFIKHIEGERNSNSYYTEELKLQNLSKGSYLLSIICGKKATSKEIIIQ